jgi:5-methyltetrahydropteroyltriglutamate--homocysteine methyltransferase
MASDNRILTTHVGSLPRPAKLMDFVRKISEGTAVEGAELDACLAESVDEVVAQQKKAGVDIVSDGEYGKFRTWSGYVIERLGGVVEAGEPLPIGTGADQQRFPEFYSEYFPTQKLPPRGMLNIVEPLTYKGQAAIQRDIKHLKAAMDKNGVTDAFLPVVAPASAMPQHNDEYYKSDEAFLFGLAEALGEEYKAIIDAGLNLQVDDAFLPYMYDVAFTDKPMADYKKWAEMRVDALNHALEGLPEEKIRYHICWGSFNVPHTSDVPLAEIVDLVLKVNAGAYCLEMANPRHEHEWQVFKTAKLPDGRKLIPGVVGHATNIVEHPELVAERLERVAGAVGRENVLAGTDCGFAQTPFTNRVHPSIVWAKLSALAEGAAIASKRLWS